MLMPNTGHLFSQEPLFAKTQTTFTPPFIVLLFPISMHGTFDILGLGCCTVDELLYVEAFPLPDAKIRVLERVRDCGGLTASALVAASRLGARCAYGAQLGHDANSRFVAQSLQRHAVDLSPVVWNEQAQPIHSTIIVDTTNHTRNIFWEQPGVVGAHDELPDEQTIRNCRVLFVDHYGTTGSIRAARIARKNGIAVVADIERDNVPRFTELLELVDHLVISQRFALHLTNTMSARDAVRVLVGGRAAVVVTCGQNGCWFASSDDETPRHFPAFAVETVDSTGCGDIFHGAYASELARGETLHNRVRFASAAAALKATRRGVQSGAPTRAEVEEFLHGSNKVSRG